MAVEENSEILDVYAASLADIFSYCVRRLGDKDVAADATSEVFVRFVQEFPRLKGKSRVEMRNWLYGTASNVAAWHLKSARRRQGIIQGLLRRLRPPGPPTWERLDWPVVHEAIARLKPRQQDIVVLRFFQGLETSEIAEILKIRHVTVRVELSRAVKKLGRELRGPFGEPDGKT